MSNELTMLRLPNQLIAERIRRFKFRNFIVEISESDTNPGFFEITINQIKKYTGFDNFNEALDFAVDKTITIDKLTRQEIYFDEIEKLINDYDLNFKEFLEVVKDALEKRKNSKNQN